MPKGRLFPLTLDELVEAAALLRCVARRRPRPHARRRRAPLDILAQQVVAACVPEAVGRGASSSTTVRRAWPYRDLDARRASTQVVALHTDGRRALLHRDGVNGRAAWPPSARA